MPAKAHRRRARCVHGAGNIAPIPITRPITRRAPKHERPRSQRKKHRACLTVSQRICKTRANGPRPDASLAQHRGVLLRRNVKAPRLPRGKHDPYIAIVPALAPRLTRAGVPSHSAVELRTAVRQRFSPSSAGAAPAAQNAPGRAIMRTDAHVSPLSIALEMIALQRPARGVVRLDAPITSAMSGRPRPRRCTGVQTLRHNNPSNPGCHRDRPNTNRGREQAAPARARWLQR
jgi:hypothetical protein